MGFNVVDAMPAVSVTRPSVRKERRSLFFSIDRADEDLQEAMLVVENPLLREADAKMARAAVRKDAMFYLLLLCRLWSGEGEL